MIRPAATVHSGTAILVILLWLVSTLCCAPAVAQADKHALKYARAPADNPLKGFVPFRGNYEKAAGDEPSTFFPHSVEWAYFPLSAAMTAANEFDFDAEFVTALDEIASRRHQAALRFYLDYPGKPTGVPQFLIDAGLKMTAYDDHGGGSSPDYSDERLLTALEAFIAALGERFDGDPRIAFVTLGLLGFWGEWHTFPHDKWFPCGEIQERILHAWTKAFPTSHLLMRTPQPNASKWPIGLHDDSFAYTTLGPDAWHFLPVVHSHKAGGLWRQHPIGGEVRPEAQPLLWPAANSMASDQTVIKVQDFAECVQKTHASWLINQHVFENYSSLDEATRQGAIEAACSLGYELHVASATFPDTARLRVPFEVSIEIENRGVAPFYQNWPIELKLDSLLHTTDWKLSEIQPDAEKPTRWTTTLTLEGDLNSGDHSLQMRAVPALKNGLPLRFANKEQQADGWLVLGRIAVAEEK
jgi:hypothetical protein